MSLTTTTLVRNRMGDAAVDMIDDGDTNPTGKIELRTGSKPTNPQVTAPGTLLATLRFGLPAYNSFSNGRAIANPITSDENIATSGVCGWFRVYDRDDNALWDGVVTVVGGGGDIEFDTLDFVQGGTIHLLELTATI